jgi:quinol monooxygenase YgiN
MSDLNVIAVIKAKPGCEAVLQEALSALTDASREEEGCRSYELFQSASDPSAFVTVEKWRSQADLDEHAKTPHVAQAFQAAGEIVAEPPAIHPLKPVSG